MSGIRRKLVLVGDDTSGKTSLAMVFVKGVDAFSELFSPTVFDYHIANVVVDGRTVELELWDTADSEEFSDRFRALTYTDTQVVLICFGIDNPDSLDNVEEKWAEDVVHHCPDIPYILVGCRKDLRHEAKRIERLAKISRHPVTPEEGMAVAEKINAHRYLECSAKMDEGVQEVFIAAARAALLPQKSKKGNPKCIIA
ncbi:small GTPase-binding protein [Calocera cornea HHB12733]|uniref:Small GTPase-binding protein n=1 Tax=Calocera cornea HHB12733 TaxID=1353952 RepID=A0A165HK18_9BASI|nr:small GTPase-binding protein [Calocera cornea HHB12733]